MMAISLHTNDVNSLLKGQLPGETSAVYTGGTFEITHPVPMGLARLVAVPYIRDLDLGVSLPFSQMRLSVLRPGSQHWWHRSCGDFSVASLRSLSPLGYTTLVCRRMS